MLLRNYTNYVMVKFNTQKLKDFSYLLILSDCFLLSPAFEVMGNYLCTDSETDFLFEAEL